MNSFERRIRAFSIDMSMAVLLFALLLGLSTLVDALSDEVKLLITASVAYFGSMIVPNLFSRGQSFGKRNQKLKVVDLKTGAPAPMVLVILREIVKATLMTWTFGFYMIICGIMISARKDGRVIHDLIFRTHVVCLTRYVNDREGTVIEQTPAMKKRMEGSTHD